MKFYTQNPFKIKNYLERSFLMLLLLFGVYAAEAQSHWVANGISVNVAATANLVISGNCTNNNGTMNNAGTISLKGNLTQSGTGTFNASGSGSVAFVGNAAQTVQSVSALDLKTLVVNNNTKLTLNSNLTASNAINLSNNSDIELGNFDLNIANGSVGNAGVNSYIITNGTGVLKTTLNVGENEFLPVGNAAYNPVRLVSNTGASDVFSVAVADYVKTAGNAGTNFTADAVAKTWNISEAVTGGNDVSITVEWDQSQELPSFDRATSTVMRWNGTIWALGAFSAAANVSASRWSQSTLNTTSFSPFSVADNNLFVALPIELISFTGRNENTKNLLQWTTAKETNNLGFDIERSLDGRDFQKIGFLAGKMKSYQVQTYDFVDNQPFRGLNYYRFKQKDIDGTFTFSKILAINNKQSEITAYPNPTHDTVTLTGTDIEDQTAKLYNLAGQSQEVQITNQQINVAHIPSGIYFLKVTNANAAQIDLKIIKQ